MPTQSLNPHHSSGSRPVPEHVDIVDRVSSYAQQSPHRAQSDIYATRSQALHRLGVFSKTPPFSRPQGRTPSWQSFLMGCMVVLYRSCLGMFLTASKSQLVIRGLACAIVAFGVSNYLTQHLGQTWMFQILSGLLLFFCIGLALSLARLTFKGVVLAFRSIAKVGQDNL